ncbi:MAG: fumarylacetoacetate hydrolase family protein [Alphaproteobacteria bacterium]
MRICYFNDFKLGVVKGDGVVDVTDVVNDIPHTGPESLISGLIAHFDDYRGKIQSAVAAGNPVPLQDVRIRPPLPRPGTISCMAVNYMENGTLPQKPPRNGFHKAGTAVIGDGDKMVLPDEPATIFEGEAELALVISKPSRNVKAADAFDHIFGYTNFIDGSARGLPPAGNVFFQAKSRDTFAPIGPFIVTKDEITDPQNLDVKLWTNGVLMQDFNTSDMAHKIPEVVEWITSIHALEPGDIIATGTNHRGLNAFQDGDKVEIEIQGLSRLTINVRDDLKRTWARETRLDRKIAGFDTPTPQLTGKYAPK